MIIRLTQQSTKCWIPLGTSDATARGRLKQPDKQKSPNSRFLASAAVNRDPLFVTQEVARSSPVAPTKFPVFAASWTRRLASHDRVCRSCYQLLAPWLELTLTIDSRDRSHFYGRGVGHAARIQF